jgi:hypothetical protein
MKKHFFCWCTLVLVLLSACSFDAEMLPKTYPLIETALPNPDYTGATFNASIVRRGTKPILTHGFVWSTQENPDMNNNFIVNDGEVSEDDYSIRVVDGLTPNYYWVRAFVTTQDNIVYGKARKFRCNYMSTPSISGINPKMGKSGEIVTVEGKNLALDGELTTVFFGVYKATILSKGNGFLVVQAPTVQAHVRTQITVNVSYYNLLSEEIFDLYPKN